MTDNTNTPAEDSLFSAKFLMTTWPSVKERDIAYLMGYLSGKFDGNLAFDIDETLVGRGPTVEEYRNGEDAKAGKEQYLITLSFAEITEAQIEEVAVPTVTIGDREPFLVKTRLSDGEKTEWDIESSMGDDDILHIRICEQKLLEDGTYTHPDGTVYERGGRTHESS